MIPILFASCLFSGKGWIIGEILNELASMKYQLLWALIGYCNLLLDLSLEGEVSVYRNKETIMDRDQFFGSSYKSGTAKSGHFWTFDRRLDEIFVPLSRSDLVTG